jgi:hypothetical protein
MLNADGHNQSNGGLSLHKRGERLRGGSKRELPLSININPLSKISIVYKPSNFLLSVSNPQSLNTCKRVGVKGHFTQLMRAWGLSTINLGNWTSKHAWEKRKFVLGKESSFYS